jgi:hypothetical protein
MQQHLEAFCLAQARQIGLQNALNAKEIATLILGFNAASSTPPSQGQPGLEPLKLPELVRQVCYAWN